MVCDSRLPVVVEVCFHREKSSDEVKIVDIADVAGAMENVSVKAKVVRLVRLPGYSSSSETGSLEMVLQDEKKGKIHASVRKHLVHMFESEIEEGQVYELQSLGVVPDYGLYRTTLHPCKLVFQINSTITATNDCDIPGYGLNVTKLAEVCANTCDSDFLVDVIGVVTGISAEREYYRAGKLTKLVVIELTDDTGKCECALFGDYVYELNKLIGKSGGGMPIVVIQFAKVKIFRDKPSLQNVLHTTRILINPQIPEVEEFKNCVAVHGFDLDAQIPLIGKKPKPPAEEEFLSMHPKKSIGELKYMAESGTFIVCAEVLSVVRGQDWWYPACKCHKAVVADGSSYFCGSCDRHVFQIVPRYKVKIEVTDGRDIAVFSIFDADMSYIMEQSCAFFVARARGVRRCPHPVEFDSIIGRKWLFAIETLSKKPIANDGSHRVSRICTEPKIIEKFCSSVRFVTPTKKLVQHVDLDADLSADDVAVHMEIGDPVLITSPEDSQPPKEIDPDRSSVKRNLSKTFDEVPVRPNLKRIRKIKLEKE